MNTYKDKRYAKILDDGTVDIISGVLRTPTRTYYHPSDAICAMFGYYPEDIEGDDREEEGYKIFDLGIKVVEEDGKKKVKHVYKKLPIVDDGPNPGPGQEVKSDKWKEIDGKWVHVYKYRSASRHVTPTKFDPPEPSKKSRKKAQCEEEIPVEEPAPVEEPIAEVAEPPAVPEETQVMLTEEVAPAPEEPQTVEEPVAPSAETTDQPTQDQPTQIEE